jgi:hypothetical protein
MDTDIEKLLKAYATENNMPASNASGSYVTALNI